MTTLADQLEALAKAAIQTADDIQYYSGASRRNPAAENLTARVLDNLDTIIAALRAGGGEAVAWMYVNTDGECEQIEYGLPTFSDPDIQLLYAAPPAPDRVEITEAQSETLHKALVASFDEFTPPEPDREKVARAIKMAVHPMPFYHDTHGWMAVADAAIAAMRGEP